MASASWMATLFKGYWSLNFGLTLHQHSTSAGDITEQQRHAESVMTYAATYWMQVELQDGEPWLVEKR